MNTEPADSAESVAPPRAGTGPLPPRLAVRPALTGTDFHDTVPLPGDRLGVLVGTTALDQVREACHRMLERTADPASTLTAVAGFTSDPVFCAVLGAGEIVYRTTGLPVALVVAPDGTVTRLTGGDHVNAVLDPADVAVLVLATDVRVADLGVVLAEHRAWPVRDLVDLVRTDGTVLVVRPATPLHRAFAAVPEQVVVARAAIRAWLAANEVPRRQADDVLLAVGEACTNAVEHGYVHGRPPGAEFTVRGRATGADLAMTVTDNGRWRAPDPTADPFRGRGIALMRTVMADVTVDPGAAGTTVTMRTTIDYDAVS